MEERDTDEPDIVGGDAVGIERRHRLPGQVGVGQHGALGSAGGAGGVHDQRRRVVGNIHRLRWIARLVHQVLVGQQTVVAGVTGDHDGLQHRGDVADTGSDRAEDRFGDHHARAAVLDQEGDLGWCEPEIDRDRDGPDHVGRQHRLDELCAVEHEDHHPVAVPNPPADQGSGQRRDSAAKVGPRDGVAQESQCGRTRLHRRMAFELIDPILSSRQIRLLGEADIGAVGAGQLRGQLVASLLVFRLLFKLIFDKTWCCLGHTMVLVARRQPRRFR